MLKKLSFPLFALLLAVTAAAFTAPAPEAAPTDVLYFQFTGDIADGDEYRLEENWMESTASGTGCTSGNLPCVVKADNIPGVTDLESFVAHLDAQIDDGETLVDDNTQSRRP